MPLYEYLCRGCGHRFEVLQRMGQGPEGVRCPACGAPGPEKQLSTFSTGGSRPGEAPAAGCGAPGCGTGFT